MADTNLVCKGGLITEIDLMDKPKKMSTLNIKLDESQEIATIYGDWGCSILESIDNKASCSKIPLIIKEDEILSFSKVVGKDFGGRHFFTLNRNSGHLKTSINIYSHDVSYKKSWTTWWILGKYDCNVTERKF